jgi:hypothetical protein
MIHWPITELQLNFVQEYAFTSYAVAYFTYFCNLHFISGHNLMCVVLVLVLFIYNIIL